MLVHTNFFYGKREKTSQRKFRKKKYPYADLSRFRFVASVGPDLKNLGAKIEFKTNENNFIDIRTSTFTNNKEYTKYLTSKSMEGTKREFF